MSNTPRLREVAETSDIDGHHYRQDSTESMALHAVSNCFSYSHHWNLKYRQPVTQGHEVIIYVMEENYSYEDVITFATSR